MPEIPKELLVNIALVAIGTAAFLAACYCYLNVLVADALTPCSVPGMAEKYSLMNRWFLYGTGWLILALVFWCAAAIN